ncbi:hypothetical protein SGPA1_41120 [Streptomyces misionensis JCM 4497]
MVNGHGAARPHPAVCRAWLAGRLPRPDAEKELAPAGPSAVQLLLDGWFRHVAQMLGLSRPAALPGLLGSLCRAQPEVGVGVHADRPGHLLTVGVLLGRDAAQRLDDIRRGARPARRFDQTVLAGGEVDILDGLDHVPGARTVSHGSFSLIGIGHWGHPGNRAGTAHAPPSPGRSGRGGPCPAGGRRPRLLGRPPAAPGGREEPEGSVSPRGPTGTRRQRRRSAEAPPGAGRRHMAVPSDQIEHPCDIIVKT